MTLTRNPDYWGRDLPVNRGLWNFDEIRLDFYREANGQFEAFKRGLYDFRVETEPLRWHDGYDFPAARNGEVIRDTIKTGMPQPSEFLVFNTRRPVFSDIRVRQALTLLFDFEWINRNYFFGLYARSAGFFAGSELSAYGRAGRRARARTAEAVRRRAYPPGYSRRQLPPARHRRLGPRSHDAAQRAQVAVGSRLRSRRNRVAAACDQNALHLRDPGDDPRPGADRAGLSAATSSAPASRSACARSIPCSSISAGSATSSTCSRTAGISRCRPATSSRSTGAARPPTSRHAQLHGREGPAIDALIAALLEARERPAFVSAVRALDRA